MNVTREVIIDLWPLVSAGEAHPDTRALVEAFLQQDPALAKLLNNGGVERLLKPEAPGRPHDREAQALLRTKRLVHGWLWLMLLAMAFTGLAFGRIVSDTSWDVSPLTFIILTSIAVILWAAYFGITIWVRRKVYRETFGDKGPRS